MRTNLPRIAQLVAIAVGIGFVALGIARGEVAVVLRKAVFVCLECIGVA